jgi:TolB-like protein
MGRTRKFDRKVILAIDSETWSQFEKVIKDLEANYIILAGSTPSSELRLLITMYVVEQESRLRKLEKESELCEMERENGLTERETR